MFSPLAHFMFSPLAHLLSFFHIRRREDRSSYTALADLDETAC